MNEDFLERMVDIANDVGKDLSALPDDGARYDMVKEIVDGAEVVFAVWQDTSAEHDVCYILVKGQALARQIVADNKMAASYRVTAVPCIDAEQAIDLLHELGERDTKH